VYLYFIFSWGDPAGKASQSTKALGGTRVDARTEIGTGAVEQQQEGRVW